MIQFKFDHRYVSDIDQILRKPEQEKQSQSIDSVQENSKAAIQLLHESDLPFALKKHNNASKASL